ncbi:glycosyltransferase family 2 protein [Actinocorallia populi]|uniref:glycosyltransferase family 2 protein n=1 Tax=Actinocorallia populi TaxID=2079200 RepID=UPI0013008854|nr:glycosyltransferase family 2 protein [Actinocorallia populi]
MPQPKVSVIVPVYNCRATLRRCIESVFEQSLAELELICVDDGSTDGSRALLASYDDPRLTVRYQPNSGGPGAPRNVGLKLAAGEFVQFLDADDWLDPSALERMVAMAEENGTDIVIGKYVGVGRNVPRRLFRRTVARTTVYDNPPDLYATLAPLKLFRREVIKDLRFAEGLLSHEDQEFTAKAYFRARGVSVLADHDCYFWVEREDGSSVMQQGGAPDLDFFPAIGRVMRVVEEHTEPGEARDRMLRRNFREEIMPRFGEAYLAADAETRAVTEEGALRLIRAHLTPRITATMAPFFRQVAHCLQHGPNELLPEIVRHRVSGRTPSLAVRDGRVYEATPGFGELPDSCYDVTERLPFRCSLERVSWDGGVLRAVVRTELPGGEIADPVLVLRRRGEDGPVHTVPLSGGRERTAEMDVAALRPAKGRWDLSVNARFGEVPVSARLAVDPAGLPGPVFLPVEGGRPLARLYATDFGNLSLEAGIPGAAPDHAASAVVTGGRLVVSGRLPLGSGLGLRVLARLRAEEPVVVSAEAVLSGASFTAELPLRDWVQGTWRLEYEIVDRDGTVPGVFTPERLTGGRVGLRRTAKPYRTSRGRLAVQIGARSLHLAVPALLGGLARRVLRLDRNHSRAYSAR